MAGLPEQVVFVTGCSSGIGRALARELARLGHRVVATARRPESLADLAAAGLLTLRLDVSERDSIRAAVRDAVGRFGRIDMVVNNAGFNLIGPLAEVALEDVRRILETNVVGVLAVVQEVVPLMAARGAGRIVNVGSMIGVFPTPYAGAYCASKAAVHMFNEVLRLELAPFGIDIVSVEPGRVRSEIAKNARADLERYESASSLYRPYATFIRRRLGASQVRPTETDVFAARVARAITRERAPRRVRAGRGALLFPTLWRFMPPAVLDWGVRRIFGLTTNAMAGGDRGLDGGRARS